MLCKKHLAMILAILGAVWYVVCFFWGFVIAEEIRQFHADFLRLSVLGWTGMNLISLLLGIIQWATWGWLMGWSFAVVGKWCAKSCSLLKQG